MLTRAVEESVDPRAPGDPEMLREILMAIRRLDMDPDLEVGHAITRAAAAAVTESARRPSSGQSAADSAGLIRPHSGQAVSSVQSAVTRASGTAPFDPHPESAPARGGAATPRSSLASAEEKCGPALPAEMLETGLELWGKDLLLSGEEHFLDLRTPPDAREMSILRRDAPSARLAAALSLVIPGLGSLYAGSFRTAAAFCCVFLATGISGGQMGRLAASGSSVIPVPTWLLAIGAVVALALSCLVGVVSVASAYRAASAITPYATPWLKRSVAGSATGSALLPGWGQFLNDQPRKGALFLCALPLAAIAVLALGPYHPIADWSREALAVFPAATLRATFAACGCLGGLLWMLSVYDAALVASQHTRRRRREH